MAIVLCAVCEKSEATIRLPSRICAQTFYSCVECFKHTTEPMELIKEVFWPDFWGVPIWVIEEVSSFLDDSYVTWTEAENYIMGNV